MKPLTLDGFRKWMDMYGRTCEDSDPQVTAELVTPNAEYYREGSVARYRFQTVWWTVAVTDRVWEALADYATWPTWWRGIRSVEVLRRGDESGVGTVLRQQWRSRVPYTLVFDLEMLRIEGGKLLDGRASGDLEGTCRWTLAPVDGGTKLRFDVNVRTGRWWMNLPIPFAPRIVRASFEKIMGWGREGLAQRLGAPVELRSTDGGEVQLS